MTIIKKYIPIFFGVALFAYYLILSWLLHRTGYEHSEALFMAEKAKILFESEDNTLLTLGTTFPTVSFLSTVLFSPFGNLFAPILASSVFVVTLYYLLIKDFETSLLPYRVFVPLVTLLFVFHPGLIYAAISGRSVGAIILFFYLLFRSLFRYYQTQTSFYLSMSSIYLTILVFCNYNFIWLLLSFFPFIALISIEGLKLPKGNPPIIRYFNSVNIPSQRRKLVNRTLALYVIIFLLPIGGLYLFRQLNFYHAGDPTYFLTSQYANWHVTGDESIADLITNGKIQNVVEQTQIIFQVYVLILTPLMILVFIFFKGKLYELFTLLAPFILMSILLLDNQFYFTIEYYLIFLMLGLLGIRYYGGLKYKSRLVWIIILAVGVGNVFTGVLYFRGTNDPEEKYFYSSIKNVRRLNLTRNLSEEFQLATFISSIASEKNKILMDDAAAYKVIAHIRSLKYVVMPVNDNFITVVENPKLAVKFICVAKFSNRLKNFSVLNSYNLNLKILKEHYEPVLMFETQNWAVYKIES